MFPSAVQGTGLITACDEFRLRQIAEEGSGQGKGEPSLQVFLWDYFLRLEK